MVSEWATVGGLHSTTELHLHLPSAPCVDDVVPCRLARQTIAVAVCCPHRRTANELTPGLAVSCNPHLQRKMHMCDSITLLLWGANTPTLSLNVGSCFPLHSVHDSDQHEKCQQRQTAVEQGSHLTPTGLLRPHYTASEGQQWRQRACIKMGVDFDAASPALATSSMLWFHSALRSRPSTGTGGTRGPSAASAGQHTVTCARRPAVGSHEVRLRHTRGVSRPVRHLGWLQPGPTLL